MIEPVFDLNIQDKFESGQLTTQKYVKKAIELQENIKNNKYKMIMSELYDREFLIFTNVLQSIIEEKYFNNKPTFIFEDSEVFAYRFKGVLFFGISSIEVEEVNIPDVKLLEIMIDLLYFFHEKIIEYFYFQSEKYKDKIDLANKYGWTSKVFLEKEISQEIIKKQITQQKIENFC